MLNNAQEYLVSAPWLAILPGAAITLAVTGFNFLGDGLRDALGPEARYSMTDTMLEVADLSVRFRTDAGTVPAVNDMSFSLDAARSSPWLANRARARASPPRHDAAARRRPAHGRERPVPARCCRWGPRSSISAATGSRWSSRNR